MQTPPNNSIGRPNFMQFRRGAQGQDDAFKNDSLLNRAGSRYPYRKEPPNEKEVMTKQISEMKKQLIYIESTKWMFENNDVLVAENYCPNPI